MSGTVTTTLASLFGAPPSVFPGWQNPSPSAYRFTLPSQAWWQTYLGGGAFKNFANFIANMVMQLIAWVLHLAIVIASQFSDPSWVIDPITKRIGTIFRLGYSNVFLRMLPFLILATAVYVVWQYLRARHTKILTAIFSTFLSGGLIYAFFFNFSWLFTSLNQLAQDATDELGAAVASTVNTQPGSMYDVLWNIYVIEPWEAGQFGHASANLHDFDVSKTAEGQTYKNDQGKQIKIKAGDNWVKLFLSNTTEDARQSILSEVTNVTKPFAQQSWTNTDVENSNPYDNIIFYVAIFILMFPVVVFLGFMGFILFAQSAMFVFMVLLGIVTVPIAFVPEVGWMVTLRWFREAVGYLLLKLANVVYMATAFALAGLVTQAFTVAGTVQSLVSAALADALIFLVALVFHEKVFHAFIRPYVEAVQGIERRGSEESEKEKSDAAAGSSSQAGGETSRGGYTDSRGSDRAGRGRTGTLSSRFSPMTEGSSVAAGIGGAAISTLASARGAASVPGKTDSPDKTRTAGRLAAAFSREALQNAVKTKASQLLDSLQNPERITWQERALRRADRLIALERAAQGTALKAHGVTLNTMWKTGEALWQTLTPENPDDNDINNNEDNSLNTDNPPLPPSSEGGAYSSSRYMSTGRAGMQGGARDESDDESFRLAEGFADPVPGSDPGPAGVRRITEVGTSLDVQAQDKPIPSDTNQPGSTRELEKGPGMSKATGPWVSIPNVPRESVRAEEAPSLRMAEGFTDPLPDHTQNRTQDEAASNALSVTRNAEVKSPDAVQDCAQHRPYREPIRRPAEEHSRADLPDEMRMVNGFASAMPEVSNSSVKDSADVPLQTAKVDTEHHVTSRGGQPPAERTTRGTNSISRAGTAPSEGKRDEAEQKQSTLRPRQRDVRDDRSQRFERQTLSDLNKRPSE